MKTFGFILIGFILGFIYGVMTHDFVSGSRYDETQLYLEYCRRDLDHQLKELHQCKLDSLPTNWDEQGTTTVQLEKIIHSDGCEEIILEWDEYGRILKSKFTCPKL